jgi:hypothetical protein
MNDESEMTREDVTVRTFVREVQARNKALLLITHHSSPDLALATKPISLQFLPQRPAIDAEDVGGAALIARGII